MRALCPLVLLCSCRADEPPQPPDPAPPAMPSMAVDTASAPAAPTPTAHAGPPPLASNCQAPLGAIEEVTRVLTVAATHATASQACVDGPGRRIAIDDILVCPTTGRGGASVGFAATYRVTHYTEGGRGHCSPACPEPAVTRARVELSFARDAKGAYVVQLPTTFAGIPSDATAVDKPHDGGCYQRSPAFVPAAVRL